RAIPFLDPLSNDARPGKKRAFEKGNTIVSVRIIPFRGRGWRKRTSLLTSTGVTRHFAPGYGSFLSHFPDKLCIIRSAQAAAQRGELTGGDNNDEDSSKRRSRKRERHRHKHSEGTQGWAHNTARIHAGDRGRRRNAGTLDRRCARYGSHRFRHP